MEICTNVSRDQYPTSIQCHNVNVNQIVGLASFLIFKHHEFSSHTTQHAMYVAFLIRIYGWKLGSLVEINDHNLFDALFYYYQTLFVKAIEL